jgi:microcystin-dependent protein
MASTYSPLLRLELIAAGEQAGLWGNTTNTTFGTLLEQAIAGSTTVALTSGSPTTYTLSSTNGTPDEARAAVLIINGTPASATSIVVPASQKVYIAKNGTTQTLTFKTAGQVGGVTVVSGGANVVFCDGTNVYSGLSKINVSEITGTLPVANGGTGATTSTGTGAVVLSASPTFTGTPAAPTAGFGTNTTQLASTAFVQAAVATGAGSAVPIGSVFMWPVAAPPANYLACNGQTVSRTTYATLFGIVGTIYGAGDGSTTFTLPNFNNRMPIGAGGLYAAAATGGSKDSVIVAHDHVVNASGTSGTESADHTHNVSDPGHSHLLQQIPVNTNVLGAAGFFDRSAGGAASGYATNVSGTGISLSGRTAAHTHSVTVAGTAVTNGVSGTDTNLPPYLGVYFVIKALS